MVRKTCGNDKLRPQLKSPVDECI